MKKSKKKIIVFFSLLGLIIIVYGFTWFEAHSRSRRFFSEAVEFYNQGDLVKTIKGEEKVIDGEYIFFSGLQQVCVIWEGAMAWPKPSVYYEAEELLDHIIQNEITIELGMQLFKQYFQLDKKYLDLILLKIGDLYMEQGDYSNAEEIFLNAKEIFVYNEYVQTYSSKRIEEITNLLK